MCESDRRAVSRSQPWRAQWWNDDCTRRWRDIGRCGERQRGRAGGEPGRPEQCTGRVVIGSGAGIAGRIGAQHSSGGTPGLGGTAGRLAVGAGAWMLEATIALELALGKWLDAVIVAAVLVFNAALGFLQQGRARAALELLRHRLAVNARARRDGSWQLVPAVELVDGDVVHVRVGDLAPADLRLNSGSVLVDQSSLTGGESVAVDRGGSGQGGLYASSTIVRGGEATGTVTATGSRTFFWTHRRAGPLLRLYRSPGRCGAAHGAGVHRH